MNNLRVSIIEYVSGDNPGWVKAVFTDSTVRDYTFISKVPVFTAEDLDERSDYPIAGAVRCEILSRWSDTDGQEYCRITTVRPDDVESTDGRSEFMVRAAQVYED